MTKQTGGRRVPLRILCGNLLVAALAYACGGERDTLTAPPPRPVASIRIIDGGEQTDTVNATLSQRLVVEVRDSSSRIATGAIVQFNSIGAQTGGQPYVTVSPLLQDWFAAVAIDSTDTQGRTSTLVRYGFLAGTALLEVSVPEFGLVDTVSYTIRPGAPVRLSISPRDTSMGTASAYQLRSAPTDQFYNPISGITPTYSATGVTVSSTGQVTAASATVRGRVVVTYRGVSDTVGVSVVPRLPM